MQTNDGLDLRDFVGVVTVEGQLAIFMKPGATAAQRESISALVYTYGELLLHESSKTEPNKHTFAHLAALIEKQFQGESGLHSKAAQYLRALL